MIQGIYHGALLGLAVGLLLTALSYACPSKYCDVVWTSDDVVVMRKSLIPTGTVVPAEPNTIRYKN
jgi:hypothetical protein